MLVICVMPKISWINIHCNYPLPSFCHNGIFASFSDLYNTQE